MKKVILILLLLATLAVAWWYFNEQTPPTNLATTNPISQNTGQWEESDDPFEQVEDENELSTIEPNNVVAWTIDVDNADTWITLPEGEQYTLSQWSVVQWEGKKIWWAHNGDIQLTDWVAVVRDWNLLWGNVVMDMTTIKARDIDSEKLDSTLKDWFNVQEYPTAEFQLIEAWSRELIGVLTMNGITKQVTFPATVLVEDDVVLLSSVFSLDKDQWDIGTMAWVSNFIEIEFDITWRQ